MKNNSVTKLSTLRKEDVLNIEKRRFIGYIMIFIHKNMENVNICDPPRWIYLSQYVNKT